MRITMIICLFFAPYLHAGVIHDEDNSSEADTTPNVSFFAADKLLEKISTSCMGFSEFKLLAGDTMTILEVGNKYTHLIGKSVSTIGRTEFRAALNFGSIPPWNPYNKTKLRKLASSTSLEAYYDLKESRSLVDTFDEMHLFEKNMAPAIAFLDKRYPSIRILFRRKIQQILRSNQGEMNREAIDCWIDELLQIRFKICEAFKESIKNVDLRTFECPKQ